MAAGKERPWYRYDGVLAVASRAELTSGSITATINVDERGFGGIADGVWTGTSSTGSAVTDCTAWNVQCVGTCPTGGSGRSDLNTGGWTSHAQPDCLISYHRLYCFEN